MTTTRATVTRVQGTQLMVAAGQAAKMVYAVIALKVLAVRFGLESLGDAGQFLSITSVLAIGVTAGTGRGLTHYRSLHHDKADVADSFTQAALSLSTGFTIVLSATLILARDWLSATLFASSPGTARLMILLAILAPFLALNGLAVAIAIAEEQAGRVAIASILASAIGLGLLLAVGSASLPWSLLVLGLQGPINLAFLLVLSRRSLFGPSGIIPIRGVSLAPNRKNYALLGKYAVVIMVPVIFQQTQRVVTRNMVTGSLGKGALGLWESVVKLQEGYMQLAGAVLAMVLLPLFIRRPSESLRLAGQFILISIVGFSAAALLSRWFGSGILGLLYSDEASEGQSLLSMNLLSDAIRAPYVAFQFLLLARERFLTFVSLEAIAACSLLLAAAIGADNGGLPRIFQLYIAQAVGLSSLSLAVVYSQRQIAMRSTES